MEKKLCCEKCSYLKCYAIVYQNYYCDHENRIDDMGKLTDNNLHKESPEWCPLKENCNVR